MRIVLKRVRDLDKFIGYLGEMGYDVEEGAHAVLLDHSELTDFTVKNNGEIAGYIIAHFLTPFFRAELSDSSSDEEYLRKLVEIKHSGEKWRIPVNPLVIIVLDEEMFRLLEDYSDEYPVSDASSLIEKYVETNPNYRNVPKIALARLLEKLGAGSNW